MIYIRGVTGEMRRNLWNSAGLQLSFEMKNKICKKLHNLFVQKMRQSLSDQIYYAYLFPYKAN
jgi:hypothetical protein